MSASHGPLFAHALPGSVLTFWQQDAQLNLSVSLPLDELIVAAPPLGDLAELPVGRDLSEANAKRLAAYFQAHLHVRSGNDELPLTLTRATLEQGQNDHVGKYVNLVVDFVATDSPAAALTLAYDAVMHEVRNHRATVYWRKADGPPEGLADFGFQGSGSLANPVRLSRPEG